MHALMVHSASVLPTEALSSKLCGSVGVRCEVNLMIVLLFGRLKQKNYFSFLKKDGEFHRLIAQNGPCKSNYESLLHTHKNKQNTHC